jgi:cell division protein FtsB
VVAPATGSIWPAVAFWLTAFLSAALFAAVLIAPAWQQRESLRTRVMQLAAQCRHIQEANGRLERVVTALKHDPDFTGELARVELDFGPAGEQRLPAPLRHAKSPPTTPERAQSWTAPLVHLFARDAMTRHTALATAAVLAVVALAFFNQGKQRLEQEETEETEERKV